MDGAPVEDCQERLVQLFRRTPEVDGKLSERLVSESARFNIGRVFRNVNVPILALQLLTWADQNLVSFEKSGESRIDGVEAWQIEFEETDPPALTIGEDGGPLYATGRLWIEPSTGRILRTEMKISDPTIDLQTEVTVRSQLDPHLSILVPARMTERYRRLRGVGRWRTVTDVHSEATYSNFHRFETDVSFTVPKVEA